MMKHYLKLLMFREGKEVMGRRGSNLWLLTLVMVATFISIAFSEGSMNYLRDKMEDPFTLWVNISRQSDDNKTSVEKFNAFYDSLELQENKQKYDYNAVITSQYSHYGMMGANASDYSSARFFEHLKTRLMQKVMDESNIVEGCIGNMDLLEDNTMGVVITLSAAKRLGFDENRLPAYICYQSLNSGADSLGLKLVEGEYYPVALPVLAVVRRLPNNVQMLSGNYLYTQLENIGSSDPFDFNSHKDSYLRQLSFFVAEGLEKQFDEFVKTTVPDSLQTSLSIFDNVNDEYRAMRTWKPGTLRKVDFGDGQTPLSIYQNIANAIEEKFKDRTDVCRIFNLDTKDGITERSMFLSVEFNSLNHIAEFESFAKKNGIQLEMEQVHSKQNFDAVATMAGILSTAMVIFSIVCIIMFMVNMLQSYFQKVKRNIGTFKAFGMNGKELIQVYVIILVAIVLSAVIMALLITWCIQGILPIVGVEKDGFNYLSLWNTTTYIATLVIFISTIFTVIFVMVRMLSQTPGDLIYDRN